MKIINYFFLIFILIVLFHENVWSGSVSKTFDWPVSEPNLFLKGGVNSVTGGGDLLFWAIGDTVSVIQKSTFTLQSTFRVKTSTEIQDMLYDSSTRTLYIAAGYDTKANSGGLQIFSISNPLNPVLSGSFYKAPDNPGSLRKTENVGTSIPDIDARGLGGLNKDGYLFLSDFCFGLRVIDVKTNPANPVEVPLATQTTDRISGYKQPDINKTYLTTGGYGNMTYYSFNGKDYVLVLDYFQGLDVFDVSDPKVLNDPVIKDTRSNVLLTRNSLLSDIFVTAIQGRLTAFTSAMNINMITDSTGYSSVEYQYFINRLDVNPDTLLVTNYGYCQLPPLPKPDQPAGTDNIRATDATHGICVSGNYAYVANESSGLEIVDISAVPDFTAATVNPAEYPVVGTYNTHVKYSYGVFLDGPVLYLACSETGLNKLDVSTVTAPVYVNNITSPIRVDDVFVSSDYTYVLDRKKGLRVFNTSTPEYTYLCGYRENTGTATDLSVSGNYAYISYNSGQIEIVQIADPNSQIYKTPDNPVFTHISNMTATSPNALFISGNYLYVADGSAGLHVFNLTDSSNPAPVDLGSKATAGNALSVYVYKNRAYVSEKNSGVEIFNVTDPSKPVLLSTIPAVDARSVTIYETGNSQYALVADGTSGLKIFDITNIPTPLNSPVVFNKMDNTTVPSPFTAYSVSVSGNNAFISLGLNGVLILDISDPANPTIVSHYVSPDYSSETMPALIDSKLYFIVADGTGGLKILNNSVDETNPTPYTSPGINSGCFIDSAFTEKGDSWLTIVTSFFYHIWSWCPAKGRNFTGEIL